MPALWRSYLDGDGYVVNRAASAALLVYVCCATVTHQLCADHWHNNNDPVAQPSPHGLKARLAMGTRKKLRKVVLIHISTTSHGDKIIRTNSPLPPSLAEEAVTEPWLVEAGEQETPDEEEGWVR